MKLKFDQIIKNTEQHPQVPLEEGKVEFLQTFILAVIDNLEFDSGILPTIKEIFENNSENETIRRIRSKY